MFFRLILSLMGLYRTNPKSIRLDIPEHLREIFGDFNKLCILRGERPVDVIGSMIRNWTARAPELSYTWLPWEEFQEEMRRHGYTLNRTTIYNYRKQGAFRSYIVTDGTSTLYQLEGILAILQTNGIGK